MKRKKPRRAATNKLDVASKLFKTIERIVERDRGDLPADLVDAIEDLADAADAFGKLAPEPRYETSTKELEHERGRRAAGMHEIKRQSGRHDGKRVPAGYEWDGQQLRKKGREPVRLDRRIGKHGKRLLQEFGRVLAGGEPPMVTPEMAKRITATVDAWEPVRTEPEWIAALALHLDLDAHWRAEERRRGGPRVIHRGPPTRIWRAGSLPEGEPYKPRPGETWQRPDGAAVQPATGAEIHAALAEALPPEVTPEAVESMRQRVGKPGGKSGRRTGREAIEDFFSRVVSRR